MLELTDPGRAEAVRAALDRLLDRLARRVAAELPLNPPGEAPDHRHGASESTAARPTGSEGVMRGPR